MKHLHKGRILGREKAQRLALLKSLACAFFEYAKIQTTVAKAKELRPFVERIITNAKVGTLAKKRLVAERLSPKMVKKVSDIAKTYAERNGGYTRIVKLGRRKSDGAEMAIIELVK